MRFDGRFDFGADRLVGFQDGVGRIALAFPVHAGCGDVHAPVADAFRDMREHARFVALPDHDARLLARHLNVYAVDSANDRSASADALAADAHLAAIRIDDADVDGVGVVVFGIGFGGERERQTGLAGKLERIAYAQIVGIEPEHAPDERLVGAVPDERVGKRSEQRELDGAGFGQAKPARHVGDAQRACGMGARRPDHDGADDVAYAQGVH